MQAQPISPFYLVLGVRLPRWEPGFRERLIAADIDPFRVPPHALDEAVDVAMTLRTVSEIAARETIRRVLPELELAPLDFPIHAVSIAGPTDPYEDREALSPPWVRYPTDDR